MTPVTPTVTSTSVTKVESPQLPQETRTESSETVTQVVQQQVDSQTKVVTTATKNIILELGM